MFPRGADAYIDDIGKLINLKDGSIRTAIDTGCGVRNVLTLISQPYFFTVFPRDRPPGPWGTGGLMLLIAISSSSFIFIIVEKVKNTSFAGEAGWTWRLDFFIFLVLWQWEILRH